MELARAPLRSVRQFLLARQAASSNRPPRRSCMTGLKSGLEGELKPDDVRRKFIDAAEEANILDYHRRR